MLIEGKDVPNMLKAIRVTKEEGLNYIAVEVAGEFMNAQRGYMLSHVKDAPFLSGRVVLPIPPVEQALREHLQLPDGLERALHLDEKVLLRNEQTRLEINEDILRERILSLGVPVSLLPDIRAKLEQDDAILHLRTTVPMDDRDLRLHFMATRDEHRNYNLVHYEARLVQKINIQHAVIENINTQLLAERMAEINWRQEPLNPLYQHLRIPDGHHDATIFPNEKIIADVYRLAETGPAGRQISEELQMKYWYQQGFDNMIPDLPTLQERYEVGQWIMMDEQPSNSIREVFTQLVQQENGKQAQQRIEGLEERMKAITWAPSMDMQLRYDIGLLDELPDGWKAQMEKVHAITNDLNRVAQGGPNGQEHVMQLLDQYWKNEEMRDLVYPYHINLAGSSVKEPVEAIIAALAKYHIEEQDYTSLRDNTRQALAQGYYQQVLQQQTIIPAEHIDRYKVIEHTHPGHQVYEMGHTVATVFETTDFQAAAERWLELARTNTNGHADYVLIGAFRHQPLQLDLEGLPTKDTGITFAHANGHHTSSHLKVEHLPERPVKITTEAIVRFDKATQTLQFYDEHLSPLKYVTMVERNEEYLQKQLKWTGFGEQLNEALKAKLKEGGPEFILTHAAKIDNTDVAAVLHFSKSKASEMYFFNRYQVALQPEKGGDVIKQSYYINSGEDNITLKQAYNQMNTRAVFREMTTKVGDKYHAWEQLNFKETDKYGNYKTQQFTENFGYDLAATLAKYPIKELSNPEHKERLMESLERGNRQSVTLVGPGIEVKIHVEAAPQWKSLNWYDDTMKRQDISVVLEGMKGEQQTNGVAQKNGQQKAPEDDEGSTKGKKRGRRMS